ncbi:winged helix-turn-helix transcriptional regulator [Gimesia aquarii]|uniref:Putative HTH-type transcriptional regulator YybR n=1 Tax=Gimesia aquarii TaxID=2527964 RepID=A0A517W1V8_9PLAN|nr:helix-turn-helix domain-containing protein [Gimesia aquarii]QDT99253.1 putative HTH-type transcriptional regulator YybR [Gimesia aquarii]
MKEKRSCCPVACSLDLIGDKWTLLIVRDLLLGRSHFKEFVSSPEKIATNILTDRLTKLVKHGLAEKFPSPSVSGKDAYRLTKKGKTLRPVIEAIANWGLKNLEGTEMRLAEK